VRSPKVKNVYVCLHHAFVCLDMNVTLVSCSLERRKFTRSCVAWTLQGDFFLLWLLVSYLVSVMFGCMSIKLYSKLTKCLAAKSVSLLKVSHSKKCLSTNDFALLKVSHNEKCLMYEQFLAMKSVTL
jgi:hypothetical protein